MGISDFSFFLLFQSERIRKRHRRTNKSNEKAKEKNKTKTVSSTKSGEQGEKTFFIQYLCQIFKTISC